MLTDPKKNLLKQSQNCLNNQSELASVLDFYKECGNFTKTASYFGENKTTIAKKIKKNLLNWKSFQKTKTHVSWSKREEETLSLYPSISLLEISKRLNRTYSCVKAKAFDSGLSLSRSLATKEQAKRSNKEVWDKDKIILKIQEIHKELSTHSDILAMDPKLYDAAQRYFGSWKNALEIAGFSYDDLRDQTASAFKSLYKSYDGNFYDSRVECTLGNFLYEMKCKKYIKDYICHKRVCEERHWRCDFYITFNDGEKIWTEYDGLGELRPNKERYDEKIKYYKENSYNLMVFNSRRKFIYFILEKTGNLDQYKKWTNKRGKIMKVQGELIEKYKKTLLDDVISVYKSLGYVPTSAEYNKNGTFSVCTLYSNIGTWREILKEANLWKKYKKKRLSKEEIEKIKKRLENGDDFSSVAKSFKTSLSSIEHIYYRKVYKKND